MKITYPECQVEITAEGFITVIDHFTTKVTCNTEPTFEPGGIISTDDDMPEPKPYPNLTDHEAIIQRGEGFKNLIKQAFKEAKDQGMLQGVQIPTEEEPAHTESKKEPAPTKRRTNNKKVQVLFETGWKTFNSISQAAKAIDARLNHLSHALLNGKTCNGHQVRYATGNKEQTQPANEEQTELP
jgi:hypothetical protein